eukprot:CAMPEP_0173379252 /NCGR_PEP_ID=MMETSP1356-20130122/2279_1 /TAXON_ID=77927 ORGANISM="Hemiselmis virescens, Strain PCC157" /NCGR_SAMPLE_ID=MMETSP1356 /ASSEMBLY_ACC=CAM_ASM_000847 /LENGTH=223 /DNA_ID=CAMNT_0014332561 /DNA_START=28 /DNA_END=699 /DNA_ORIENTATION=+
MAAATVSKSARIVIRKLDVSNAVVTLGSHFMDGRFKVKAPNITILDVGNEAKGGVHPSKMSVAIWGALLRGLMKKVNLFKYAGAHDLGGEISTAVTSLLGEVKGGVESVRMRLAQAAKVAADAVRDEVLAEQRRRGNNPQQEARERFHGPEGTWDDEEERRKQQFEDYDPNYPPQPGDEDGEVGLGGVGTEEGAEEVLLSFEKGLKISQEGAREALHRGQEGQ